MLGGKPRGAKRGKAGDRKVQEVFKPPDPPDYFDLEPLKKALRLFLDANCNNRTRFRHDANRNIGRIELCFKGEDAQLVKDAFKVNTTNFALHLEKASFPIDPTY